MKKIIFALFLLISVSGFALKNWQNFTNTTHIYDIEKFEDKYYVATWGGVLQYDEDLQNVENKYTNKSGLSSNMVKSLAVSNGNLLMAMANKGVCRFDGNDFILPITTEIGLETNNINKVITKDNFIYFATKAGISIFEENENFPIPILTYQFNQYNGLENQEITSLVISENGYIFCGGVLGLEYIAISNLESGNWIHLNHENSELPSAKITSLSTFGDKLAIGTYNGLVELDLEDFSMQVHSLEDYNVNNESVYPVFVDSNEDIWFGLGHWDDYNMTVSDSVDVAVCKLSNDEFSYYDKTDLKILSTRINNIKQIDNSLFFLTWGEGFVEYNLETNSWKEPVATEGISSNFVRDLQMDKNNILWISNGKYGSNSSTKNEKGLSVFDGNNWINYNKYNSNIITESIYDMTVDNDNRKWFASWGYGVSYYDEDEQQFHNLNLSHYPELYTEDGNPSRTIPFIEAMKDGEIAFASYPNYIAVMDELEIIAITELYQPSHDYNDFILMKQFDDLFIIGCRYSGVRIFHSSEFPTTDSNNWEAPAPSQLRGCYVNDIQHRIDESGYDEYWIATNEGLFCYKEKPVFNFDGHQYPAGYYWYRYGQESKKKQIYINNDWRDMRTPEFWYVVGQPYLYGGAITVPTALFVDPFGKVWIGTESGGFTVYDIENDTFTNFDSENSPLINDTITDFEYDNLSGKLYIGTANGLSVVQIGISEEYNLEENLNEVIAYPNPFNPAKDGLIKIENKKSISMPKGDGFCRIFDLSGDLIIELKKNDYAQYSWDGKNHAGEDCATGVYLYMISAGDGQTASGKIVLIK